MPAAQASQRRIRLGSTSYPVRLPRPSDIRLHVAAVILTLHVLGQTVLDFRVSVPQIMAAIGTTFVMELVWVLIQRGELVWPASAMLTGSGVALILRVNGTEANDPWSLRSWYVFAGIAGLSLLTKYALRFGDRHIFNPSNLGLVAAFLMLGSSRIEPLDFWWRPLDGPMMVAYAIILVGGLTALHRLRFLDLALTFWSVLALGLGLLSAVGHCITASWALHPVCDWRFWRVVVASPETMVFVFFMISDPRTIPSIRSHRMIFGATVAAISTLLIAPQRTEFGAKVGLLGGLLICSAMRGLWEYVRSANRGRVLASAFEHSPLGAALTGRSRDGQARVLRWASAGTAVLAFSALLSVAGAGARTPNTIRAEKLPDATGVLPPVDPSTLPAVTVDPVAIRFDPTMASSGAQSLAAELAWMLQIEARALLTKDTELIRAVDHGRRRDDLLDAMAESDSSGRRAVSGYHFDELRLTTVRSGSQGGVRLALESQGTFTTTTVDAAGLGTTAVTKPLRATFVLLGATNDRWFLVDVIEETR